MQDFGILNRLQTSPFRAKFRLDEKDRKYIQEKGMETIRLHAFDFVEKRLAPAVIENDGKQTPTKRNSHPIFIAQHATGCCCRGCLERIHNIPKGIELDDNQINYILNVLMTWIEKELN